MYFVLLFWALCYVAHHSLDYVWVAVEQANSRFYHLELGNRYDKYGNLQRTDMRDRLRASLQYIRDLVDEMQQGIRWAAAAAVPALVLVWLVCCALGYGALWDTFFPSWLVAGSAAVGDVVCDYLLENLFWEVR